MYTRNANVVPAFWLFVSAGEKRRTGPVPERGLHEVLGRQGRRPEIVLPVLRRPVGRVVAHHGHNVLVRRVRRHAVLQRTSQGTLVGFRSGFLLPSRRTHGPESFLGFRGRFVFGVRIDIRSIVFAPIRRTGRAGTNASLNVANGGTYL